MKTMKRGILALTALVLVLLAACSNSAGGGAAGGWVDDGSGNTDASTAIANASELEQAVIDEMNFARTKPQEYVTERLVPQQSNPTVNINKTSTYQSALQECIYEMNSMDALGKLSYSNGLYKAAKDWVDIQGPKGTTGHQEPISTAITNRISKYCKVTANTSSTGENIAYGYTTAKDIVIALLVDDEISDRGHRVNILGQSTAAALYTHAGVAVGSHSKYSIMCCIDYAGGYSDK